MNKHNSEILLTGTMTQKYASIILLFVTYIGIVFKYCQTYGSLHQWTSQLLWHYLGSETYTPTVISQNIVGNRSCCVLYAQEFGRTCPAVSP